MSRAGRGGVLTEYRELAARYDRRWSAYIEATLHETMLRLPLRRGNRLLDVGCGTGVLLERVRALDLRLRAMGADPSSEMLDVARRRLARAGLLTRSLAEALPFPDEAFDVVVSTSALHYFSDPAKALEEMGRVLRPGGRLVITDWCADYLACRVLDLWLRGSGRGHSTIYGQEQLHRLVEESGLTEPRVDRYRIRWLWGLMSVVARKPVAP